MKKYSKPTITIINIDNNVTLSMQSDLGNEGNGNGDGVNNGNAGGSNGNGSGNTGGNGNGKPFNTSTFTDESPFNDKIFK